MNYCFNCLKSLDGQKVVRCEDCNKPLHKDCSVSFDGAVLCDNCFIVRTTTKKRVEFDMPEVIRRTHIETYRTCPKKFFHEVIEGHEQPPNEYTQIGSDLHELFEKGVWGEIKSAEEMWRIFEETYVPKYGDDLFKTRDRAYMRKRAIESIENFFELLPTIDTSHIVTTEKQILFPVGEGLPSVSITMDLVTGTDELHVHDWKTGKVMVGQKLSTDLQAPLYIYAIQKHFEKPVKSFTFYYLQEKKTRQFVRSDIDPMVYICRVGKREYKINIMDAIREVNTIFSNIKKGNFSVPQDTKKMYFPCKMCHIREAGLCRGADEESWYEQ